MKRTILTFSAIAGCLVILFKLSEYSLSQMGRDPFTSTGRSVVIVIAGCSFIAVGFLIYHFSYAGRRQKGHTGIIDDNQIERYGISKREHQILVLMAKGMSNSEIGSQLHISENTVKTHVSNILSKLNARRRTEAVRIAREKLILPL